MVNKKNFQTSFPVPGGEPRKLPDSKGDQKRLSEGHKNFHLTTPISSGPEHPLAKGMRRKTAKLIKGPVKADPMRREIVEDVIFDESESLKALQESLARVAAYLNPPKVEDKADKIPPGNPKGGKQHGGMKVFKMGEIEQAEGKTPVETEAGKDGFSGRDYQQFKFTGQKNPTFVRNEELMHPVELHARKKGFSIPSQKRKPVGKQYKSDWINKDAESRERLQRTERSEGEDIKPEEYKEYWEKISQQIQLDKPNVDFLDGNTGASAEMLTQRIKGLMGVPQVKRNIGALEQMCKQQFTGETGKINNLVEVLVDAVGREIQRRNDAIARAKQDKRMDPNEKKRILSRETNPAQQIKLKLNNSKIQKFKTDSEKVKAKDVQSFSPTVIQLLQNNLLQVIELVAEDEISKMRAKEHQRSDKQVLDDIAKMYRNPQLVLQREDFLQKLLMVKYQNKFQKKKTG